MVLDAEIFESNEKCISVGENRDGARRGDENQSEMHRKKMAGLR